MHTSSEIVRLLTLMKQGRCQFYVLNSIQLSKAAVRITSFTIISGGLDPFSEEQSQFKGFFLVSLLGDKSPAPDPAK